jgi:hypothetical protein
MPRRSSLAIKPVLPAFVILLAAAFAFASDNGPLVIDGNSHIVVMEYEAWFGPHAVTFRGNSVAIPLLQSADMQTKKVGGGYDSADPLVIKQHVTWMEYMGVDAVIADLTNNVSCIFNSEAFVKKYVSNCTQSFRIYNQSIRDHTGNLFSVWSELGTSLKIIPQLGGIDGNVLIKDEDGKTAFEKEIEYFGALLQRYPDLGVIYQGKPLMLVFLGAAQQPDRKLNPLWFRLEEFLQRHPEISEKYTFKMIAGYIDSQPDLWETQGTPTGPVQVNPAYGFWSWVDRLNRSCTGTYCPYYPSYNRIGSRVENFTASIATAGQNGWGCPDSNAPPSCFDDALRFGSDGSYTTFNAFMAYAKRLQPTFLLIHQFNEFAAEEGWNANTNDDIEPANLWGKSALKIVKAEIEDYRQAVH